MAGHKGPSEGARAWVRGHLLHSLPHPSGSHPMCSSEARLGQFPTDRGPQLYLPPRLKGGRVRGGLCWEKILEEREKDEMTIYLVP